MTDLNIVLRSILLDPADDAARFAYADLLDEAGFVNRAAYIRLSLEVSRTACKYPAPKGVTRSLWACGRKDCRACRLRDRVVALAVNTRDRVVGLTGDQFEVMTAFFGLPPVAYDNRSYRMSRGFLLDMTLTVREFNAIVRDLFSAQPAEGIVFVDAPYDWLAYTCNAVAPGNVPAWLAASEPKVRQPATTLEAEKIISQRAVNYGRSLVGLPPLYK